MAFTVLYGANVLYPNTLRDLLIRIAQSGAVQAKWTNAILDEMTAALRRTHSFLTRYTSTCRQRPHPSGRSPTPAPTRPKQSRMS